LSGCIRSRRYGVSFWTWTEVEGGSRRGINDIIERFWSYCWCDAFVWGNPVGSEIFGVRWKNTGMGVPTQTASHHNTPKSSREYVVDIPCSAPSFQLPSTSKHCSCTSAPDTLRSNNSPNSSVDGEFVSFVHPNDYPTLVFRRLSTVFSRIDGPAPCIVSSPPSTRTIINSQDTSSPGLSDQSITMLCNWDHPKPGVPAYEHLLRSTGSSGRRRGCIESAAAYDGSSIPLYRRGIAAIVGPSLNGFNRFLHSTPGLCPAAASGGCSGSGIDELLPCRCLTPLALHPTVTTLTVEYWA